MLLEEAQQLKLGTRLRYHYSDGKTEDGEIVEIKINYLTSDRTVIYKILWRGVEGIHKAPDERFVHNFDWPKITKVDQPFDRPPGRPILWYGWNS